MANQNREAVILSLNHGAEKLPEAVEYAIRLLAPSINLLAESKLNKEELASAMNMVMGQFNQYVTKSDFAGASSVLQSASSDVAKLKEAMLYLAAKVDNTAEPTESCADSISDILNT